jgi:hypothetical protein
MGLFDEKSIGRKSRDTVPLSSKCVCLWLVVFLNSCGTSSLTKSEKKKPQGSVTFRNNTVLIFTSASLHDE